MVQVLVHGEIEMFFGDPRKLFGFIQGDDGTKYFLHAECLHSPFLLGDSEIAWVDFPQIVLPLPKIGDRVVFEVGRGKKLLKAKNWTYEHLYEAEVKPEQ